MTQSRQLAAIMFTDIVGYTALMQENEGKAVALIKHYNDSLNRVVAIYDGSILNNYGDGSLCTFPSVSQAINCSIELQKDLQAPPSVPLRIGLHIGEVFFEGDKALGDGVNVSSRIQSLGQANTILFSRDIFDNIRNQPQFKPVSLGKFEFKNVNEPIEVYALANNGLNVPKPGTLEGKLKNERKKNSKFKIAAGITMLLLLILAATLQFLDFFDSEETLSKKKSIAILPFRILGDNKDNISEGLVEDILVRLSKIKEIKVISNRSSVRYANSNKSLKEIGQELNVRALVMGSIQQVGNRIRVSAQLIDSEAENTIWAEDYDRDIIKVFDLQTEVALQIVDALKATLSPTEIKSLSKRYTENVEAYKFYRKGRSFWDKRTKASFDSAAVNYKMAIQLDPDYALAYAGLADCYTINEQGLSQLEAMPIARDYVNKALALDSTLSEALTTKAFIHGVFDYDFVFGKNLLEKAISFDPNNPIAHLYYANYLVQIGGQSGPGIHENKKALELDPLSVNINYILGRNFYFANKLDSAFLQLKKTLIFGPNFNLAKATLAYVLLSQKNYPAAFEVIRQLPKTGMSTLQEFQGTLLSYAYAVSGDHDRAIIELENTLSENPRQMSYPLARVYTVLKDYDKALTKLEDAYKFRELNMVFLKIDPTLDPLRKEARFIALMNKMKL